MSAHALPREDFVQIRELFVNTGYEYKGDNRGGFFDWDVSPSSNTE